MSAQALLALSDAPSDILPLRPYQRAALDAVHEARARQVNRQIVSLPTGAGKTVVATHLINEYAPAKTVFLVHRDELVTQSVAAIRQTNPHLSVGVVKAASNQVGADVVVASVQTLAHEKRIASLVAALRRPILCIADECHHAVARTVHRTITAVDPDLLVGLTATAYRADKAALGQVFDEIVYHLPMLPLILDGKLANLIGVRIDTAVDLDDVHTVAGEFAEGELAGAVDTPSRNQLVVDSWRTHAWEQGRRRTVAFCVNTAHAEHLRDTFRANGVACEMVLGRTPSDERAAIFQVFHEGKLPVLVNVMVLSEGWDEPLADCGLMVRPTKSLGLYVQMAGRLARKHPTKSDATIVDFVDNTSRHSLVTLPTLAGREAEGSDDDSGDGSDRRAPGEQLSLTDMVSEIVKVRHLRDVRVNLFGTSPYVWHEAAMWMTRTDAQVSKAYLALLPEGDGYVPIKLESGRAWLIDPPVVTRLFDRPLDLETAKNVAETMVPKGPLNDREAKWRDLPPTDAQLAAARRDHIEVPRGATRGEISVLMDRLAFNYLVQKVGEAS